MSTSYEFTPGLYRHYKGGLYTAICLVTHHETRKPMVLYVSHTYGGMNVRPLHGYTVRPDGVKDFGWSEDPDGWADEVDISTLDPDLPRHPCVLRFQYIGPLPSDTPVTKR